ncbi:MAG: sensor histidine kinase [Spirochaetes bacterium]|nr:sensor histidine kinase [Spirochaetota bacterium]
MAPAPRAPRLKRRYYHRVVGLFLAAALVPVFALSVALTGIVTSTLERAADERGRAARDAFANGFAALLDDARGAIGSVANAPETKAAFDRPADEGAGNDLARLLAREAAKSGAFVLSAVGEDGRVFSSKDAPPDLDPGLYGSWGLLRMIGENPARVAITGRRRVAGDGTVLSVLAGRALPSAAGGRAAVVACELRRDAVAHAAASARDYLVSEALIADRDGIIVFSLADPAGEGGFIWEPAVADRTGEGRATLAYDREVDGFSVRVEISVALVAGLVAAMRDASWVALAVFTFLAAGLALFASRLVTRPVEALSSSMLLVRSGDLSARVRPASDDELGDLAHSFNAMASEIHALMRSSVERQELLRAAELKALAAQMNPHFLYNSLNSLRSLAKLGRSSEIVETVTLLGKLLRSAAETRGDRTTVGAALDFARQYVALERVRFGGRLRFEIDVDPSLSPCLIPGLVLEPLVENALIHGLERSTGPWTLRVSGRVEARRENGAGGDSDLVLVVEDDGPGADPEALAAIMRVLDSGEPPEGGAHLGLAATNRRLKLSFGPHYGLSVCSGAGAGMDGEGRRGFSVIVRIPGSAGRNPIRPAAGGGETCSV